MVYQLLDHRQNKQEHTNAQYDVPNHDKSAHLLPLICRWLGRASAQYFERYAALVTACYMEQVPRDSVTRNLAATA